MEDNSKAIDGVSAKQPCSAPPSPSASYPPRSQRRWQNHSPPRTYEHSPLTFLFSLLSISSSCLLTLSHFPGLLSEWSKGPHLAGYVDFAESIKDHHPQFNQSFPWASWSNCPSPTLSDCRNKLEECLESMAHMGVKLGTISSHQIFSTLNKWHGLNTALASVIGGNDKSKTKIAEKVSKSVLWDRAVFALSARCNAQEIDGVLGLNEKGKSLPIEESSYYREAIVALRLAKEVIRIQHGWRANAIAHLNQTGGFSRSLANSCTDWPCLLLELLSQAAEIDNFQVAIVIVYL